MILRLRFLLLLLAVPAAAQVRLEGVVLDRATNLPVAQAHVQHAAGAQGSVTNENGRFRLEVERLPATLVFRHLGYAVQQVEVREAGEIVVRLEPAQITLGEVLVVGDEFAASLVARAIRRKQQGRAHLETLAATGYARLRLENQGEIVLLAEAVFDAYWDRARGAREVIRSRRETGSFYRAFGLEATGPVPNFYDDRVEIGGLSFIGPLHPDALAHYTFTLARRREAGAQTIYDLYMTPRTTTENTFVGALSILDGEDALVYADLRPARHVVFPPPVVEWRIAYTQQYGPTPDSLVWWPLDLHAEGRVVVQDGPRRERSAFVSLTGRLQDATPNAPLPAAPFARPERVQVDVPSVMDDRLFYRGEGIVPLSPREVEALGRLQGFPETLASAFPARDRGGLLNAFRGRYPGEPAWTWPEIWGARFRARYNRVDGIYRSVGLVRGEGQKQIEGRLGQRSARGRLSYYARARRPVGPLYAEIRYDDDVAPQGWGSRYPAALASIPALAGVSYFDWGVRVETAAALGVERGRWQARAEGGRVRWRSIGRGIRSSPFARFGPNPPLDAAPYARGRVEVQYARPETPARFFSATAEADVFSADAPGTGTRAGARLDLKVPTFDARRFNPNTLRLRLAGGASAGALPVQERPLLDGQMAGFAAWGTLHGRVGRPFAGTAYAAFFWEHDFQTRPFELVGLWPLVGAGTGLALRGAGARVWHGGGAAPAWHHEIGLEATGLLGTPLRAGVGRRLDAPGWFFHFGLRVRP